MFSVLITHKPEENGTMRHRSPQTLFRVPLLQITMFFLFEIQPYPHAIEEQIAEESSLVTCSQQHSESFLRDFLICKSSKLAGSDWTSTASVSHLSFNQYMVTTNTFDLSSDLNTS